MCVGDAAASGGHIEVLEWIPIMSLPNIYEEAARFGQLHVIQWAISRKFSLPSNNRIFAIAAQYRQWEILHFLHKNGFPLTENVAESAASGGNLEVLKWLVNNGYKLTKQCAVEAAKKGHSEVFLWLFDNGCQINLSDYYGYYSLNVTNIDILKWAAANDNNYFKNPRVTENLLRNNCLEDLQWLYENGYFSNHQ